MIPKVNDPSIESRISRVEGEIEQLTKITSALAKTIESGFRDVHIRLDSVAKETQPDISKVFSLILQSAGCLIVFIAAVATPIAYHFNKAIETTDLKLQKEYSLINDTQKERQASLLGMIQEQDVRLQREFHAFNSQVTALAAATSERRTETLNTIVARIGKIEDWANSRVAADLEELRQRRMKEK